MKTKKVLIEFTLYETRDQYDFMKAIESEFFSDNEDARLIEPSSQFQLDKQGLKEKIKYIFEHHPYGNLDLWNEVSEFIDTLPEAKVPSEWISVEDKLPKENNKHVQFFCSWNLCQYIGVYNSEDKAWFTSDREIGDVSHWRELPQPPISKMKGEK